MPVLDAVRGSALATAEAKSIAALSGLNAPVLALAFSPDRTLVAAGCQDGTIGLWDVNHKSPRPRGTVRQPGSEIHSLAFAPNGRLLAVGSGALNGLIWLYDVTEKTPQDAGVLRGAKGAVDAVAFSADGKLAIGVGEDRTVRLWEHGPGTRGDARAILPGHTAPVKAVAFAPDGLSAASAGRDGTLRIWSVSRIRCSERGSAAVGGEVEALAYSPDGKTLASAGRGTSLKLWDLSGLKPAVRTDCGSGSAGACKVLLTPDGQFVVGAFADGRTASWDVRTGKPAQSWAIAGGSGTAWALTGDGRYLARGSDAGSVDVFRVAEKRT